MISEEAKLLGEVARDVLRNAGDVDAWDLLVANEWIGVAIAPEHGGHGGTLAEAAALTEAAGATASGAPVLEAVLAAVAAGTCRGGRELVRRFAEGEERAVLAPGVIRGAQTTHVTVPWVPQATTLLVVVEPDRDGDGEAQLASSRRRRSGRRATRDDRRYARRRGRARPHRSTGAPARGCRRPASPDQRDWGSHGGQAQRRDLRGPGLDARPRARSEAVRGDTRELSGGSPRGRARPGLPSSTNAAFQAAVDRSGSRGVQAAVAARVIAGNAAREVARIAHQVHGAIGVTREYELHRFTLAMQAWRDAYGTARCWEAHLGHSMVGQGERFWDEAAPDTAGGARS